VALAILIAFFLAPYGGIEGCSKRLSDVIVG